MELVNLCLYAEGYYSGRTYEENIWITKATYERVKESIPSEIFCGELDGKHSQVMGDIEIQPFDEAALLECSNTLNLTVDGERLEDELRDIFATFNLDYDEEQIQIKCYLESLDMPVEITVYIKKSRYDEFREIMKSFE